MYAVIQTGGKQDRVAPGDIVDVERLPDVSEESPDVVFDRVLLIGDDDGDDIKVGSPTVEGAAVKAVRMADVRGPKVVVFKMKRRKGYRRKRGHRQNYLRVRIQDIQI